MNAPTDTDPGSLGSAGQPSGQEPGDTGPRVTRDEVRDLGRLRRSRSDRKVAGVADGIARHLDIDPLLVRIAFVVLTFFGGGGVILYGAAWLVVPEEDTDDAVIRLDDGIRSAVLIIAGILAAASLVGDSIGGFGFPWPLLVVATILLVVFGGREALKPGGPTHPWLGGPQPTGDDAEGQPQWTSYDGHRPPPPPSPARPPSRRQRGPILFLFTVALAALLCGTVATLQMAGWDVPPAAYPATVMATCGLMLLVGAFYGRAGGLILVGLLAAGATAVTTAADQSPDFSVGQVLRTPTTAAEVEDLDLGLGEIKVDLTGVADPAALDGETLSLDARVGRIEVVVPDEGLTVEVDADAEAAGDIRLFDNRTDNSDRATHDGGADAPVLTIDADVFLGEIVVHTEEQAA